MKLKNETSGKVFFTADTHFNHGNILRYCKRDGLTESEQELLSKNVDFRVSAESVKRMDDYLIDGINSIVGRDDTLWHLGDFCFASKHEYQTLAERYRNRIHCKNINFIFGNHDSRSLYQLFTSTGDLRRISVNGQDIIVAHYALAIWEKSHHGAWMLYGHSHSNAEANLDAMMPGRRSFDVGVDNAKKVLGAYRPWSFDEIKAIMDQRKGVSVDHHGSR